MSAAIVIFAKWPAPGQVKTRLCPPLTHDQAAELARGFLIDTVERVSQLHGVQVWVAYAPAAAHKRFAEMLPPGIRYLPQRGRDLGERELNIFVDLFAAEVSPVLLMGSDIPTLPLGHLKTAFDLLSGADAPVVFGPSRDGGYYCVGARAGGSGAAGLAPLFEQIDWGTQAVLRQSLGHARRQRIRVRLAPDWYDVDTLVDVRRLHARLSNAAADPDAPRTRALLRRLAPLLQK